VRVVVDEVAEHEAAEGGVGGVAEDEQEAEEEEGRERDRHRRRHHQAQLVVGMVVVDAVDDEVHPPAEGVVGLPVEDQAVEPVLGERPEGEAAEVDEHHLPGVPAFGHPDPLRRDDHRHEHDRRDRRMDPGEEVEEFALEEGRRRGQPLSALVSLHLPQC
jgi:hypothetical protein